ncbi:Gag-Pol polyprotein [Labeo rohita]|uniref:Gag-Pol polyprotein n=1 Tax=Labeo rohita TaxID=84645 RepID=A0ABQ8M4X8_LABRO|nr:Gag-Pol polyprotein [Labeo rohita]
MPVRLTTSPASHLVLRRSLRCLSSHQRSGSSSDAGDSTESQARLTAVFLRAAAATRPGGWIPTSPGRSRSDDWFSAADTAFAAPSLGPFFPEVQEELNYVLGFSPTPSSRVGVAGNTLTPSGEVCGCGALVHAIRHHLCCQPWLKAGLTVTAGHATSALHVVGVVWSTLTPSGGVSSCGALVHTIRRHLVGCPCSLHTELHTMIARSRYTPSPLRRHCSGPCPAVLGSSYADRSALGRAAFFFSSAFAEGPPFGGIELTTPRGGGLPSGLPCGNKWKWGFLEAGFPGIEKIAWQGTFDICLPGEGQEGVTSLLPPTFGSVVPNHSQKEQFSQSLGLWPRAVTMSDVLPPQVQTRSLSSREPGAKGYVSDCSVDPACLESGSVVIAPQPVSLIDPDSPARLYDPIQTAPAQIQRHPFHLCPFGHRCLCAVCGDCGSSGEECDRAGPSSRDEFGVLQPLFHRTQKVRRVTTYPGLRVLNRSLHRLPFRMLTAKRILLCICHQDWFAVIDLKDAYFHVSILPRHRLFLGFAFEGRAYQYRVLPFEPSGASGQPGEEQTLPCAEYLFSWHGVRFGQYVGTPHERAHSVSAELSEPFHTQDSRYSQTVSEAPGAYGSRSRSYAARTAPYEAASALALWPNPKMGMAPRHVPGRRYPGMSPPFQPLLRPFLPTGRCALGSGVEAHGYRCLQDGLGCRLQRADSFGLLVKTSTAVAHQLLDELLAVLLALRWFLPMLRDKHVLIRTDNVPTVTYINRQRGLCSRRMSQLARQQTRLRSLRAVHIPGELNHAADALSRQLTRPGEWRLHPQVVQLIWSQFEESQVDLFASPESFHCQLFYPLSKAPPDSVQDQGGRGAGLVGCALLAHPDLVCRPYAPRDSPSLEDSPEVGPSFSGNRHNLAPASRPLEPPCVVSGRDSADLTGPPQAVINTITQARAPSIRQAYALKWGLFADWCSSHWEDPQRCSVGVVLSFLQDKLKRRLSPSTLKAYGVAIAAYHDAVNGLSIGKHHLIARFLRGARRLNPPCSHLIPSWDLSVVLLGLRRAPRVVDAITLAYQCQGELCPLGVRAHSTGVSPPPMHWRTVTSGNLRVDGSVSACCAIPTGSVCYSQLFPYVNSGSSWPPQFRLGWSFWIVSVPHIPSSIQPLPLDLIKCLRPPNACFSYLAPLRTTEGERLGYICNPRSLKEGTETLRPLATVRDCAGGLGFGSAPQLKSE